MKIRRKRMKKAYNRGLFGERTINTWLDSNERIHGITRLNVEYLRVMKELDAEMAKCNTLNYFLAENFDFKNSSRMLWSGKQQRGFYRKVISDLKVWAVTLEWKKVFDREIKKMFRRRDTIMVAIRENIRETEHYPYFEAVGFERIQNLETRFEEDEKTPLDDLIPAMEAWEAAHPEEIRKHMEAVAAQIEARDRHKAEVKAREKAEKDAIRAAKKAEKDEIKEMQANARKHQIEKRKWEKEMETTLRHVGG
jgi:hypothetical protein